MQWSSGRDHRERKRAVAVLHMQQGLLAGRPLEEDGEDAGGNRQQKRGKLSLRPEKWEHNKKEIQVPAAVVKPHAPNYALYTRSFLYSLMASNGPEMAFISLSWT